MMKAASTPTKFSHASSNSTQLYYVELQNYGKTFNYLDKELF